MSFWNTSDGDNAAQVGGEFEAGGGNFEPIPAGTTVLAAAQEAHWDEFQGDEYINLTWVVLQPEDYKNKKIFQKVRVLDRETKKADKAKRMLAAIDTNAGGGLLASGEMPTDETLARCLVNKPMMLRLEVWELDIDGQTKTGNWVSAVAPRGGGQKDPAPKPAQQAEPQATQTTTADGGFDSDVPF